MIVGLLLLVLGILISASKRANLLYLFLLLYPFDGALVKSLGISVFQVTVYMIWIPFLFWLGFDTLVIRKKLLPHVSVILLNLGILYLYIFTRYLAAIHPEHQSFFLVLTSGFILMCGVFYYYDQLELKMLRYIAMALITVELYVVVQQALLGSQLTTLLGVFDFSDLNSKVISTEDFFRGTGTFRDPNYFALFMAAISSFLMIEFSWLSAIFYILGIVAIQLSFSRMGIILGLLLITVLVVKLCKYRERSKYLIFIGLIVIGFVAFQLNSQFTVQVKAGLETIGNAVASRLFNSVEDFDAGGRGFIIESYFKSILNFSNFFIGVGFLNFQMELERTTGVNLLAHNEYLQIFADLGLIGVALILWVVLAVYKAGGKTMLAGNPYNVTVCIVLIGNMFLSTGLYIYVYFIYALYGAFILQKSEQQQQQQFKLADEEWGAKINGI